MKVAKRLLSLVLAGILVAAAMPAPQAAAATFVDTAGHWAESSIVKMNLKGVLQGTAPGQFQPDRPISRLELAVMLVRAEGLDQEARAFTQAPVQLNGYAQLPAWSWGYMNYALALGLLDDQDTANFRPSDSALRYQVAVMMIRTLDLETQAQQLTTTPNYTDAASIPQWARGYVTLATSKGLFKGDSVGAFRPLSTVTRGEMATLLDRLDRLQDNKLDLADQKGTISQVVLGTAPRIDMRLSDGSASTLYLNQDVWMERNGVAATLSSLRVGDRITAVRDPAGGYGYLEADSSVAQTVTGTLAAAFRLTKGTIVLTMNDATTAFTLAPSAVVVRKDGDPAADTDLLVGDQVRITVTNGQVTEVSATSNRSTVTGTLATAFPVGSSAVTLATSGTNTTYPLASIAVVVRKDGRSASNDDLWVGDRVTLTLVNDNVTEISATSVSRTVHGFITSVILSATSPAIGVTVGSNPEQVFRIPPNVPIYQGTAVMAIADVNLGAYVELTATGSTASRVTISNKEYLQELAGVIVAVNATRREITLAITDQTVAPTDATRKVVRVPATTIVVKHGILTTFADLKVGDRVQVTGSASSTAYTAQTVVVTFTDAL
ncbi:MAG: S-layer homology domain-containing protein [Symbiobacteriia bacterium]